MEDKIIVGNIVIRHLKVAHGHLKLEVLRDIGRIESMPDLLLIDLIPNQGIVCYRIYDIISQNTGVGRKLRIVYGYRAFIQIYINSILPCIGKGRLGVLIKS